MAELQLILDKYELEEGKLFYNKANELLTLITDKELEELFATYPKIFQKVTGNVNVEQILSDVNTLKDICTIFKNTVKARHLTEDEYLAMTIDDIKEYIYDLPIVKNDKLLNIIYGLEGL